MIIVMNRGASQAEIDEVCRRLKQKGYDAHLSQGVERTVIGAVGGQSKSQLTSLESLPGVEKVVPILKSYKLAGREFKNERSVIQVGDIAIGGENIVVMAGPCAVESREQLLETARSVKRAGAQVLRGGAFKPRTSPYSFQGMEEEGLKILSEARDETGLYIATEITDTRNVELVARYSDILQVGARNMQNFQLLRELGKINKPVLLKRGPSATIDEWIMAAEYIMAGGNYSVIFCERGIRTFENYTRNTLDLSAIPAVKHLSHLPIVIDPSHGTGKWRMVQPMAMAATAAGADGLMIEVHPNPAEALSDGPQSLTFENFHELMQNLGLVASAVGRKI